MLLTLRATRQFSVLIAHTKKKNKKKKNQHSGSALFFLLSVFNTFQGTLKAFSTTPQGHRSLLNLIQGALLQLLNCTIVALDWSQSIENRIGNHVGSKHGQNVERY